MSSQINFSDLIKQLLDESMEATRCWAKLGRMNAYNSYRKDYIRYAEDADKSRKKVVELLVNGKYISQSKEVELAKVKEAIEKGEKHRWEIDFVPRNNDGEYAPIQKREMMQVLEDLKKNIESGRQADIEKAGQRNLREEQDRQINEKISEVEWFSQKVDSLISKDNLSCEDYWQFNQLKIELEQFLKLNTNISQEDAKKIQINLDKVEGKFPKQIKIKFRSKGSYCSHSNICWVALFQKEKTWPADLNEKPYCLECGEDKDSKFCSAFQKWYSRKIENWLTSKGLTVWDFENFLSKKSYLNNWISLKSESFISAENKELNSLNLRLLRHLFSIIEEHCLNFAKEKGAIVNDIERERERERERISTRQSQLRTIIQQLEQKPSKSPQEEAELASKKKDLAELEKKLQELDKNQQQQEQTPKNKPWGLIIGGGALAVVGLVGLVMVIVKVRKNKKRNEI